MFELNLLIDLAEGLPGMLIPVFTSPNTNIPYVQQMDEFMLVKEVVPFLEYENYVCLPHSGPQTIALGDKGIIAFRSFDESIICGDFEEVTDYIDQNRDPISEDLVLLLQLQRIESSGINPSYELWRQVAAKLFSDEAQAKFWVDSELQLFQKQKKIWSEIDPISHEDFESGDGLLQASVARYGTEFLILWLSNRRNFSAKNWTTIWHYVHERLPFDDRISQVALSWMYSQDAEDHDLQQSKSIIYALLQGWILLGKDFPDYGEFLSDQLATDPSLLFGFLRPKKLFTQLFEYLSVKGNLDDVLTLVKFGIANFPKEEYIIQAFRACLAQIAWQTRKIEDHWIASTHNREFEQTHINAARDLWIALEEIAPSEDAPWVNART